MTVEPTPFEFFTVAHVTRIGNLVAWTLEDLLSGIDNCGDNSIFHHTFQTLGIHHFLTEGFSNDFAQWVLDAVNRDALAEQLAALDVRDYQSIAALRADLSRVVRDYCQSNPLVVKQKALEPFYFCESVEVTLPLGRSAKTLKEFREGLTSLSHSAFYFHFISSRLRLQLRTNDFSLWIADSLGLPQLASNFNRIDIYTNTLDSARATMVRLIDREMRKS
jgi:hypothetical protein